METEELTVAELQKQIKVMKKELIELRQKQVSSLQSLEITVKCIFSDIEDGCSDTVLSATRDAIVNAIGDRIKNASHL